MLKWLVIGIGDITTKRVIPALRAEKRSELWGIVTRDPAKAATYGVRAFTDLNAALAADGADAVYVASPVFLHAPQALASLGQRAMGFLPVVRPPDERRQQHRDKHQPPQRLGVPDVQSYRGDVLDVLRVHSEKP